MASMTKSPPWETFAKELNALFHDDSEVTIGEVMDDGENKKVCVYVSNSAPKKYNALNILIPTKEVFGNVTLYIQVVTSNTSVRDKATLFKDAFEGNSSVSCIHKKDVYGGQFAYVVFKPEIAQFFDDNIGDLNGNKSMLRETIARDVFGDQPGVFFCTNRIEPDKAFDSIPF